MSLARVVITDYLQEATIESPILADVATIDLARASSEAELAPRLLEADVLIVFHGIPRLGPVTLAAAPKCRGIVRAGVGYNNVDIEEAGRRGVIVCNVPDYGTEEVADHALMLLLAAARRLTASHESIRRGEWGPRPVLGAPRLRGKVLGIVGCGRIGTAMALRGKALGLDVVFYDPYQAPGLNKALGIRRVAELHDLLAQADFVSLHCYLDEKSRHLMDEAAFRALKPGAYLINTARGPVVDETALLAALDRGQLAGAGLDVFEEEPLRREALRLHPAVTLTPHIAYYAVEGYQEMRTKAALEARRLLLGESPHNPVNLEFLKKR